MLLINIRIHEAVRPRLYPPVLKLCHRIGIFTLKFLSDGSSFCFIHEHSTTNRIQSLGCVQAVWKF